MDASPAADAQSANDPPGNGTPEKLGVLFVHGMGEQARGDTLLGFGEPVVKFLRRWIDRSPTTDPFASKVDLLDVVAIRVLGDDPDAPAHTTVKVDVTGHRAQSWLVAESWWASDFKPANFNEVLNWGIRVIPFVLHHTLRHQLSRWPIFIVNGQLILTLMLGPFLPALLLLMLPIAAIPFLRGIVGNVMVRLANSLGDPYLLLSSPIRLASMVERVHHDIRWLQDEGCTGISIVAHSQGAAVAHHALRSFPMEQQRAPFRRFVTFGAAIEKLHFLQNLDVQGKNLLRGGIVANVCSLALVGTILFAWRIPWGANDGHWWVFGLWLLFTCLFWFSPWLLRWLPGTDAIRYVEPGEDDLWDRENNDGSTAIWDDLYARSDPVSLGPITALLPKSREIRNQDSIFFDHTTYFENTDQFMVKLVGGLCTDSGWTDLFDSNDAIFTEANTQRSRRVDYLNYAVWVVSLTVVVTTLLLWRWLGYLDNTGLPLKNAIEFLGDELKIPFEGIVRQNTGDGQVAEALLGIVTLVLAAVVTYMVLIQGAWHRWNAGKTDRLLRHRPLGEFREGAIAFFFATLAVPVAAALYLLYIRL